MTDARRGPSGSPATARAALPWPGYAIARPRLGLDFFFLAFPSQVFFAEPHGLGAGWLAVDGLALVVATAAFLLTRFPLLGLEIVYALWYAAHELAVLGKGGDLAAFSGTPAGVGTGDPGNLYGRLAVGMLVLSLLLAAAGIALDRGGQRPIAFWLHIGAMVALLEALLDFSHGRSAYLALPLLAVIGAAFLLLWQLLRRVSYGAVAAAVLLIATAGLAANRSTTTRPAWRS